MLSECPKKEPKGKCSGNLTCTYGEVCCCGKCYNTVITECEDGQWMTVIMDACMHVGPDGSGCGNNNLNGSFMESTRAFLKV